MVDPVKTLANVLLAIGLYSMVLSALLGFGPLMFYFLLAWGTDPRGGEMSWGWLLTIQALGIALLIFIPTFLMGATLPLTLQVASGNSNDAGKTVGTLYSINTLGSILGSFLGGLVILPLLQLQSTLQVMALLYTVPGFILAMKATSWRTDAGCEVSAAKNRRGRIAQTALLMTTCFALLAPRWDPNIMSSGLFLLRDPKALKAARELRLVDALPNLTNREMLYYREGVSATVAVFKIGEQFTMSVGGKPDASSGMDMSTQIGLSLVPILLHPDPKDVLVIGLGSGVSVGAALARQSIQHVDVVEMSPEVVEGSAWFEPFNRLKYDRPADGPPILNTPNVQLLLNDGRNHLLLSSRKYDVIASEPSNPWLAGVGNLFTEEAFQLARRRLKAGGLMCQWIHSYNLDGSHVHSIIKTFGKVFPHIQLWWINREGDYLLIGSDDPIAVPLVALRERLAEPNVKTWLKSIHLDTEEEFLAGFVLHDGYLKRLSAKGQLHSDDNMLLEFSAPMALYASTIRRFSTEQVSPLPEKIVDWKGFSNDEKSLFLRKLDLAAGAREHLLTGPDNSLSARHLDRAWQMAPYQLFASDYYAKKVAREAKSVKLGNQNDKIPTTDDTSELRKQAVEALENQRYSEALGLFRHRYFLEPDLPEALLDLIEIHLKIVIAFEKKDDVDTQIRYACIARKLSRLLTHWKPAMPEGWMNLESAYGMLAKLDARDTVFYQSEVEKCQKESLNAISPKLNPKRD
jgi:spermidine synthase